MVVGISLSIYSTTQNEYSNHATKLNVADVDGSSNIVDAHDEHLHDVLEADVYSARDAAASDVPEQIREGRIDSWQCGDHATGTF